MPKPSTQSAQDPVIPAMWYPRGGMMVWLSSVSMLCVEDVLSSVTHPEPPVGLP